LFAKELLSTNIDLVIE